MTTSKSIQAARLVWHHRQSGQAMAHFPDAIRPHNRQEGYAEGDVLVLTPRKARVFVEG